jgi:hypothetical protein
MQPGDDARKGVVVSDITTPKLPWWVERRRRLQRLARLLEACQKPVRPFQGIEGEQKKDRLSLRQAGSPLAIAYEDPLMRWDGLRDDSLGEAIAFFHLSFREAHALFCECGYLHSAERNWTTVVAKRIRATAAKSTLSEYVDKVASFIIRRAKAPRMQF